jgi:cell wall-associated NlpC family hydrolase
MNQQQFISKVIGNPWIDRTSSFDSCDCWGLCRLYYQHVLNIELPTIAGYTEGKCDTAQGWQSGIHDWEQVDKPSVNGLVFTCYKDNKPTHVGIVISPVKVLHSRGNVGHEGKTEIHSIRAIESIYGEMTFHQFIG